MLHDVAGDAEATTLSSVNRFEAYCCHWVVAETLQQVAMDVRISDAQPLMQAPYFALMFDSGTDKSVKKEELLYVCLFEGT